MTTAKRLYFYGVSFVALPIATFGAALLLRFILDSLFSIELRGSGAATASLGVAMIVVGTPVWALHWLIAQRQASSTPAEAGATLRKLHINAVLLVSAFVAFLAARGVIGWLIGLDGFDAGDISRLIAWAGVFAYYRSIEVREGQPSPASATLRRWYVYLTSGYCLFVLLIGVIAVVATLLLHLYDTAFGPASRLLDVSLWGDGARGGLRDAIAGGAWWAAHWLLLARGDAGSTLRQVYLYLFAFLAGAVSVFASTTMLVVTLLQWVLRVPAIAPAGEHFLAFPAAMPHLLVGVAALGYHWSVTQAESTSARGSTAATARQSFEYIMAALGLGTLAVGIMVLIGGLVGVLLPPAGQALSAPGIERGPLAWALTLVMLGAPVWFRYWLRVQRSADREGLQTRATLPRRLFLYVALGILAVVVVGGLVGTLSRLLTDVFEGHPSLDFLREEAKWFFAIWVTGGVFLAYYWQVLREDQRAGSETATSAAPRMDVTLVVPAGSPLAARLAEQLGDRTRLNVLRVAVEGDGDPSSQPPDASAAAIAVPPDDLEALVTRLSGLSTRRALVIALPDEDGAAVPSRIYPLE